MNDKISKIKTERKKMHRGKMLTFCNSAVMRIRKKIPYFYGILCVLSYLLKSTLSNVYCTIKLVLFKSFRNSKRRNKGNFTSKSNSNKTKLCGGQYYLVLNKILTL